MAEPVTCEELAEALKGLANEAFGSLGLLTEAFVRREIGNTNYHCIMERIANARALLSRLDAEQKGDES